ncbi:MAG: DUF3817 domain-containing protein [Gammaproteobacteria bacterium]|nr:DUF3817 domain-containing protein [Gammaproteobacteria bacterium]
MNRTLRNFRLLALIEGISLLLLLLVAMPLKYYAGVTQVVPVIGMIHGLLFMAFMMFSLDISHKLNWSVPFWLLVLFSSIVPAGTFLMDLKLKKINIPG